MINADPQELAKFSELAHLWWDPESDFRPLHRINPLRLDWIDATAKLSGKRVLDVGCGGGILSDSMARCGARVLGIDLASKPLRVAQLHALEAATPNVEYREVAVEALAAESPATFDVVTCMEMLEHVPDPAASIAVLGKLLRPGGDLFVSTINRNFKSFLLAIVGAEYVANLVPRGTHEYERLLKPSELARFARAAALDVLDIAGLRYDPVREQCSLTRDPSVNYLMHLRRTLKTDAA
jgi:2-polyprenyl-6-hydroxyphenyl methylase/3-demethylubiquinone-9 3-methyltransferase